MNYNNMNYVRLTDDSGQPLYDPREVTLESGTIVLVNGLRGTAYQRLMRDGLWHSVTGQAVNTTELWRCPNMYLIFSPSKDVK